MVTPLITDMALITDISLTEISVGVAVITGVAVTTEALVEVGIMDGEVGMVAAKIF
jgi:hypothetical protein